MAIGFKRDLLALVRYVSFLQLLASLAYASNYLRTDLFSGFSRQRRGVAPAGYKQPSLLIRSSWERGAESFVLALADDLLLQLLVSAERRQVFSD